jgi:hypothetical protein
VRAQMGSTEAQLAGALSELAAVQASDFTAPSPSFTNPLYPAILAAACSPRGGRGAERAAEVARARGGARGVDGRGARVCRAGSSARPRAHTPLPPACAPCCSTTAATVKKPLLPKVYP